MLSDKYIIPVFLAGTVMFLVFLFFIVMYVLIHRRRRQEASAKMAKMDWEHRHQLLVTRLEEQERAMAHISREIHDNVSQQIDLLMMHLKAAEESGSEGERLNMLANGKSILSHISNDLRNASYTLNGNYIKLHGLHEVLQKSLSYIQSTKKTDCRLRVEGRYRSMAPDTELLIFRIAQEALHNAMKHSDASRLEVLLNYRPSSFYMEISDNGVGFSMETLPGKHRTLGLQNMTQRADLLSARLEIHSAPDEGCRVRLTLEAAAGPGPGSID